MNNNRKFFECSCLNEIMRLEKWEDDEDLSIAIYKLKNYPRYLPLFKRIALAFRILFKGDMYNDDILLEKKDVLELKDWLNKNY